MKYKIGQRLKYCIPEDIDELQDAAKDKDLMPYDDLDGEQCTVLKVNDKNNYTVQFRNGRKEDVYDCELEEYKGINYLPDWL